MYRSERLNTITHLIGAGLAAAGLAILVVYASVKGDPWKIVSFSVYGTSLVVLYTFSTLYHGIRGKAKTILRKFDHSAIYLLIAGTYTPFTLVTLRGAWGWWMFGVIWGLAVVGILQDVFLISGRRILPVVIYVVMGWFAIVAIRPLMRALPSSALALLAAGGVSYTAGIVFYALDTRLKHGHGIFHLLVLAGSLCHYVTIFFYVA